MKNNILAILGSIAVAPACIIATPAAQAAVIVDLSFSQPTGTAAETDPVPIYITLAFDAQSEAVDDYVGANSARIDEFRDALLAAQFDLNASVNFGFGQFMTCSAGSINTFIGGSCDNGPYTIQFENASLAGGTAGASYDVLFGTFLPKGGSAPGGTYTLYDLGFDFYASGSDANGNSVFAYLTDEGTRITSNNGAPFVRQISGDVPEPASWALLLTGFGMSGWAMRRQRTKVRFA